MLSRMAGGKTSIKHVVSYWRSIAGQAFKEAFSDLWGSSLKFMAVLVAIIAALIGWGAGLPIPTSVFIGAGALVITYLLGVGWKLFSIPARRAGDAKAAVDKRALLERLGDFLARGTQLQARCFNESEPTLIEEFQAWRAEAEAYMTERVGASYVARWNTDAGIAPFWGGPKSGHLTVIWSQARVKCIRLQEFLAELA
jgi:hypothetical protein